MSSSLPRRTSRNLLYLYLRWMIGYWPKDEGKPALVTKAYCRFLLAYQRAGSHFHYLREHEVQGNSQLLGAMYMSKTRWVCNDRVGHKGFR